MDEKLGELLQSDGKSEKVNKKYASKIKKKRHASSISLLIIMYSNISIFPK
jgi:hypothetical protein